MFSVGTFWVTEKCSTAFSGESREHSKKKRKKIRGDKQQQQCFDCFFVRRHRGFAGLNGEWGHLTKNQLTTLAWTNFRAKVCQGSTGFRVAYLPLFGAFSPKIQALWFIRSSCLLWVIYRTCFPLGINLTEKQRITVEKRSFRQRIHVCLIPQIPQKRLISETFHSSTPNDQLIFKWKFVI